MFLVSFISESYYSFDILGIPRNNTTKKIWNICWSFAKIKVDLLIYIDSIEFKNHTDDRHVSPVQAPLHFW